MAERKFYTAFNRPPFTGAERIVGESLTSTLGYADHNHLIQSMLHTGDIIKFLRGAEYDIARGSTVSDEDIPLPESRKRGFSLYELGLLKTQLDNYLASKNGPAFDVEREPAPDTTQAQEPAPVTAEGAPSES